MKTAAILLDEWKLPTFRSHLTAAGYTFEELESRSPLMKVLKVQTDNLDALGVVIRQAEFASRFKAP